MRQNQLFTQWGKGLLNRGVPRLGFPADGLADGQNVILADGGIRTRPGMTEMSGNLPAGTILALHQVYFPTNDVSYLLAQVQLSAPEWVDGPVSPGPSADQVEMEWNSGDSQIFLRLHNESTGDQEGWTYDPSTETWTQRDLSVGPTGWDSFRRLVYDPDSHHMIGFKHTYSAVAGNSMDLITWAYTGYWLGSSPAHNASQTGRETTEFYRDGDVYFCNGEWSHVDGYESFWIYKIDMVAHTASVPTALAAANWWADHSTAFICYDSVNDYLYLVLSYRDSAYTATEATTWLKRFDFATETWETIATYPNVAYEYADVFYHAGRVLLVGGTLYEPGASSINTNVTAFNVLSGSSIAYPINALQDGETIFSSVLTEAGQMWCYVVDQEEENGRLITASGWDVATPDFANLYATPTILPATTAVWEKIYDLGADVGPISLDVLHDRAIITDTWGTLPPLVFLGCLSDDGSDWATLKAAMASQDGYHLYDISQYVLDRDSDNEAFVGGLSRSGYLGLWADVPDVEAFYVEMGTPNTGSGDDDSFDEAISFATIDDTERRNLQGDITQWVQDSADTGHFEDSLATPLTLGAGNDCPDVAAGLQVTIDDTVYKIAEITGDGEASGEVRLNTTVSSGAVSGIYALTLESGAVTTTFAPQDSQSVYSGPTSGMTNLTGGSVRIILLGSDCAPGGLHPIFTFKASSYGGGFRILHASIVERSSGANGTTTPTQIKFSGGQSAAIVGVSSQVASDRLWNYYIDPAKQYLVTLDIDHHRTRTYQSGYAVSSYNAFVSGPGSGYYWGAPSVSAAGYNYPTSWDQQTVTGYTLTSSYTIALSDVEVLPADSYTDKLVVGHTTDSNRFPVAFVDTLTSVAPIQTTPGSSILYHAVSLDGRDTYQVWVDGAWRYIVRQNVSTWQYNNSGTATPSWVASTINSLLGALEQAFTVAKNQMSRTTLSGLDDDDWFDTNGIVRHGTSFIEFAYALQADGTNRPTLSGYSVAGVGDGAVWVQGWQDGDWSSGVGWVDNTEVDDISLAQDGSIVYQGLTPFQSDYKVLNYVAGYPFLLHSQGTVPTTSITRILYKAPCQPLANIGGGVPEYPIGFIFHDEDTGEIVDGTILATDETVTGFTSVETPLGDDKALYIGYLTEFTEVDLWPFVSNAVGATLVLRYWDGSQWVFLSSEDGTAVGGAPLATRGLISWSLPDDWRECTPVDARFYRGFYIQVTCATELTSTTSIGECKVFPHPPPLRKAKEVVTFRDRMCTVWHPAYQDMVKISREHEEYGFWGGDSAEFRVGGLDAIQAVVAAWDSLILAKPDSFHQLTGSSPQTFAWEAVEAARITPVSSRVIVKAPIPGDENGLKHGLLFLNQHGAWALSGLHTDSTWDTSRAMDLSKHVNWWDENAVPRIDTANLAATACGVYWPRRNWVLWSVPMIVTEGETEQTTNNRVIVYDLTLKAWLPLFHMSLSALCLVHHRGTNSPGDVALYAGDYEGRILRLFPGGAVDDVGTEIACNAKTGLIDFGEPGMVKVLMKTRIFGQATGVVTCKIYADSKLIAEQEKTFPRLTNPTGQTIDVDFSGANIHFRYLQFVVESDAYMEVEAVEVEWNPLHYEEGQGAWATA
jgi:hypothetical protein